MTRPTRRRNVTDPDPFRPLEQAAGAARWLGIIHLVIGSPGSCCVGIVAAAARGGPDANFTAMSLTIAGAVVPALLYFTGASQLRRHKTWAVIPLLVMTTFDALGGGAMLALTARDAWGQPRFDRSGGSVLIGTGTCMLLFVCNVLIVHLCRSFPALRVRRGAYSGHAFEPVMPTATNANTAGGHPPVSPPTPPRDGGSTPHADT